MKKKSENKKTPFNVLRKPFAAAMVGITMTVGCAGLFTGCSGDKGDKGDTGAEGKSAYELAVENGFEGTVEEWLESLKGTNGNSPTITIDPTTKNWLINGQDSGIKAEGTNGAPGQSIKGDTGNGVESMDIVYEYDEDGNQWAVFTITYTESETPEIVKVLMPRQVKQINELTYSHVAKLEQGQTMQLSMNITYDDYRNNNTDTIAITDDMYVVDEHFKKPDFTTVGTQQVLVRYQGIEQHLSFEVVDLATHGTQLDDVSFGHSGLTTNFETQKVGFAWSDLIVQLSYTDAESVYTPVTTVFDSIVDATSMQPVQIFDNSKTGKYLLMLKPNFVVDDNTELLLDVYNPEICNIRTVEMDRSLFTCDVGTTATNFLATLVGKTAAVIYYEEVDGKLVEDVTTTEEMFDISDVDFEIPGTYPITVTYALEDQDPFVGYFTVDVVADMEGAAVVETLTTTNPALSEYFFGAKFELYDNGIAVLDADPMDPGSGTQYLYDEEAYETDGVLKIYDTAFGDYCYFAVNKSAHTYDYYTHATAPAKTYTTTMIVYGDPYQVKLEVYGEYDPAAGTPVPCKADVSIFMGAYAKYSTIDVVWKDANTIAGPGKDFVVGTDLTEVNA